MGPNIRPARETGCVFWGVRSTEPKPKSWKVPSISLPDCTSWILLLALQPRSIWCPQISSFAMLGTRGPSTSLCLLFPLLALYSAEMSHPPQRRFEYKLSFKGPRLAVPGAGIPFWSHHGGEKQMGTGHAQGPSECWRVYSQMDSGCGKLYAGRGVTLRQQCLAQDPSQTCLLLCHAKKLCLSRHPFFVHGIYLWRTQRHWQNELLGM